MFQDDLNRIKDELNDFSKHSKVWVYLSDKSFENHQLDFQNKLNEFIAQWGSHGKPIKGIARTFGDRFILIFADIEQSEVSGCATDSSIQMIKQLGNEYKLNFFDRNIVAYIDNGSVSSSTIAEVYQLNPNTLVFNPFFVHLAEWRENFYQPLLLSKWKRFAKTN